MDLRFLDIYRYHPYHLSKVFLFSFFSKKKLFIEIQKNADNVTKVINQGENKNLRQQNSKRKKREMSAYAQLVTSFGTTSEEQAQVMKFFLASFVLSWTWSMILAIFAVVRDIRNSEMSPKKTFVPLLLFSIFCPLHGFLNFLVCFLLLQFSTTFFNKLLRFPRPSSSFPRNSDSNGLPSINYFSVGAFKNPRLQFLWKEKKPIFQ